MHETEALAKAKYKIGRCYESFFIPGYLNPKLHSNPLTLLSAH